MLRILELFWFLCIINNIQSVESYYQQTKTVIGGKSKKKSVA